VAKAAIKAVDEQENDVVEEELTREEVALAFDTVNEHIQGLAKLFNHNGEIVRKGFYSNDIWFETLRLMLVDVVRTQNALCKAQGISSSVALLDDDSVAMEAYWEQAAINIEAAMNSEQEEHEDVPVLKDNDAPVVREFGGEFGGANGS